jgi:uncharacterized protein (TIGR02246 family)
VRLSTPFAASAACAIVLITAVPQRDVPALTPDTENAIRALVGKYVAAREERDPAAIEALFTSDADQLTSSGEWRRGRTRLVPGTLASSERTGGTREITVETVRLLAPDVAIADGRYEISGLAGGGQRVMFTTLVLTRDSGNWRIAAIRNMLPATPVPAGAPGASDGRK